MYTLFSVDDHLVEPRSLWSDRVPAALRDRAPHVVEDDGREYWVWDGGVEATMGLNAVAGQPREQWGMEPKRFDDMIPGCYEPKARVADLLSNGIFASVAFPTLPGFGGRKFATFPDPELAVVCVQAWNDYVIDEWCAAEPEVLVPMTIAPVWDVELAVAETERCLERGTKALCWIEDPANIGLPGYHDGLLGSAVRALRGSRPPGLHAHRSARCRRSRSRARSRWSRSRRRSRDAARSSVNMMVSPIPRRYPNVKLVWSEGGIGWIPAAIERADRQWERHQYWTHVEDADVLPSDVARRNMWFCMIEEPVGLKYRHDYGVDRILWESDYPHADTPFPDTQAACEALFDGVPRDEVETITHENAEALFKFPLSRSLIDRYAPVLTGAP